MAADAGRGEGHGPNGKKQPYWIHRQDGAAFWLGGLWDHWIAPDGSELQTCCILTNTPQCPAASDPRPHAGGDPGWMGRGLVVAGRSSRAAGAGGADGPRGIPPVERRFLSTGSDLQTRFGHRLMNRSPSLRHSIPKLLF
ncbi:SOS response-associated peptidase family protein [Cyanobium gracile UHCC 0139]|uniref:SOS response-associated peptidase family protein n=1 Tax=Cyanobium gracile UHCC 0139 TaxID=3110308 RepID=A0ABU5RVG2_9CYAN|nr:SOS response-associated peptidase family protein [Cyanobium gracile]MEA5391708.1 SOS response-associated peptidase family protein [Cyanobium gracile UHCC 0139]